jgi:peptide/nickel transport system substrate-binding protein
MGADNQPLPYMDSIRFINLGTDPAPALAALQSGEIDLTGVTAPLLETIEGTDILIATQVSSYTHVIRMRADKPPFDDVRVRNAIKACQDREAIRFATMRDYGALGEDHHVAPIHPEYCPMDPPERDINLEMMPSSMYWEQWMEVDFGITSWTHRPLAVMLLSLAYKSGVPWNETHWSNEEFDSMLAEAEGTLDVEERRQIMCDIQTLMKEEGPIALPRYGAFLWGHHPKVKNYRGAPNDTIMLDEVWLDEEA